MPQKPPSYRGIPGRYMPKMRARAIHAFQRGMFWCALGVPVLAGPIAVLATGSLAMGLVVASAGLALAAMVACTVVDLMSMRIPDGISALPILAAVLWWAGLALGAPVEDGAGFGRQLYAPVAPGIGPGSLVPSFGPHPLWADIALSVLAAVLVGLPLVGSFILGAMGGGDVKFVPPFALYLGWPLAFDLLFLTFLFGGVFALGMMVVRRGCRWYTRRVPGKHPELERVAGMRHLAYAPAIAAAGVCCLAAKWEGLFV